MPRAIGAAILAGFVIVILLNTTWRNQRKIANANAAAAHLEHERDSLVRQVAIRETQQSALISERRTYETQIADLRASVSQLERRRAEEQFTIRRIRTTGALQHHLRTVFPELGDSAWGITTVPLHNGDTVGLEYLMVPAWFAEVFAIDRANARSWEAQRDRLLETDSLRVVIAALQDSVTVLEASNGAAYASGYRSAHIAYDQLNRRYVAELRKPQLRIAPVIGILGAVGVGLVVGRVLP